MSKNVKTLLFEGAGMSYDITKESDIGNYRIRTSFLNNEGKQIYLELGGHEFNDKKNGKHWQSHIDFVHYVTGDNDDCMKNVIEHDWQHMRNNIGYTKENIIKYINELCNTSFETLEVLHDMEGYRVHSDNRGYNLMDNHNINRERTNARINAYNEIDLYYRQKLNEKYSKISLLKMDDNSITIRCYASSESLNKAGLTVNEREKTIIVNY